MRKRERMLWLMEFVLTLVIVGLAGCGVRASTSPSTTSAASPPPSVSASPSATVMMATVTVTAAATNGWATYTDSYVGFQVPLPPGWRAGAFTSATSSGSAQYIVQFFPPQSHGTPSAGAAAMEPELIQITVVSAPPHISVADNPHWIPVVNPVAIGNTPSTMYELMPSSGSEVNLIAATKRGAMQFVFNFHILSPQASTTLDTARLNSAVSLYLGMLQGFRFPAN